LYGAENWAEIRKYLENFEMWYWRRMDYSWTDHMGHEEMLQRVKEEMNIIQTIKRKKANGLVTTCVENAF
jgi:hypothetical protein